MSAAETHKNSKTSQSCWKKIVIGAFFVLVIFLILGTFGNTLLALPEIIEYHLRPVSCSVAEGHVWDDKDYSTHMDSSAVYRCKKCRQTKSGVNAKGKW